MAVGCTFFLADLRANPIPPDEDLTAEEIVEQMVEHDEMNYQSAKDYEYQQTIITEKLNKKLEVVSSKTKTARQRLPRYISYEVRNMKEGEEVETSVGLGPSRPNAGEEGGSHQEAFTIRELVAFYDYHREKDETVDGIACYVLSYKPKDKKEIPKARSTQQKVLSHLTGKLHIHPEDFIIIRNDSDLISPMPFVFMDLVSLRSLHVHYDAVKVDKVWLPQQMEISYQVRILYFSTIRERQRTTMGDFVKAAR